MSENQRSAEQSFLDYCHLVVDSFAVLSKGDSDFNEEFSILKERAYKFLKSIDYKREVNPYEDIDESKEFMAQLFKSTEILKWLYEQLKILHSNITVEKKGGNDEKHEFVHPFLPQKGDAWYTTPRLPICMGWIDYDNHGKLKFPENHLPSLSYSLLDKHFLPAYLYILTAFDDLLNESVDEKQKPLSKRLAKCKITTDNNKQENALEKLLEPFFSYWESNKKLQNILQKIVLNHQPDFKDKYPPVDLEILDDLPPNKDKRRIFFEVQVAFDRWLSTIGIPKDWTFNYELKKDIERKTGCIFREEGESLWEVLKYSILLLDNKKNCEEEKRKILDKLFVLFWIKTEKSGEVSVTERGNNLLAWWRRNDIKHCTSDFSALEEQLLTEIDGKTYQMLLGESSINIPVNAFFLAMPPPEGVYRCEITYSAYENTDDESSVEKIWVLAAINFPETEILKKDSCPDELVAIICKQKVLMGLLVDPLLRDYLKEDMKSHIKENAEHAKELELARRRSEFYDLLMSPLNDLIGALDKTRKHGQHIKSILDRPDKLIFSAFAFAEKYFDPGSVFELGGIRWEVEHQPSIYKSPFAACATLAAVVGTIFGQENLIDNAKNGKVLLERTMVLLHDSHITFEEVLRTLNVLLWYHGKIGEMGKDMEQQLGDYMSRVLTNKITDKGKQNTTDKINFSLIKESLGRFKETIHTAWKSTTHAGPLASLATIFYSKHTPTFSIKDENPDTYSSFGQILINRRKHSCPFHQVELPVPTYGHLLNFLMRILEYVNEDKDSNGEAVALCSVQLTVEPTKCCYINLQFSSHVFKDMFYTFEKMKEALKASNTGPEGNFLKPFVKFCSTTVETARFEEQDDCNKFVIAYGKKSTGTFLSSIYAKGDTFRFSVDKN